MQILESELTSPFPGKPAQFFLDIEYQGPHLGHLIKYACNMHPNVCNDLVATCLAVFFKLVTCAKNSPDNSIFDGENRKSFLSAQPGCICARTTDTQQSTPRQSRGSVPSSHARGQRIELRSRQYLFKLSWFGLASTPVESLPILNPAFLLSASHPLYRCPSEWFGSLLCGIGMRLHGLEGDFQ